VTEQARHSFEDAIGRVQPAAQSLIAGLRAVADAPDEVGLEFGLELSAEAGAFIASASSTANFRVTLTWRRDHPA
jgi:Trypsin-co-occurring domain 1